MGLIQLIKDFRKWRKEKCNAALIEVIEDIADEKYLPQYESENVAFRTGCMYALNHRKEILKKVKI